MSLNCSVEGMREPEIQWMKDGAAVQNMDQMFISISEKHWVAFLRWEPVPGSWVSPLGLSSYGTRLMV